jgi:hypothetical protein
MRQVSTHPDPRWGAMLNRGDRLYLKQEDQRQAETQVEQVSKER